MPVRLPGGKLEKKPVEGEFETANAPKKFQGCRSSATRRTPLRPPGFTIRYTHAYFTTRYFPTVKTKEPEQVEWLDRADQPDREGLHLRHQLRHGQSDSRIDTMLKSAIAAQVGAFLHK
jgi:hypothetical protein